MSTLALTANRAVAGRARATALLRSPLPVWAALFANVLAFSGLPTLIPIPTTVGQLITQGALILAFLLALLANPQGVIRPSLFMVLLTMLAVVALMVSIHNQFICRVDLPCMPPHWLHDGPVAAHPLVGEVRLRSAALPYLVLALRDSARFWSAPYLPPARRSLTTAGSRARCGRYPRRRWPTTQPFCSGAPWCCGSVARYAVEPPC